MPAPYTHLAELLAPYFRRGWADHGTAVGDVVARMTREASPDLLHAALAELDHLIGRGLCEPQIRDVVLYELDCEIEPDRVGLDYSAWLLLLRDQLHRCDQLPRMPLRMLGGVGEEPEHGTGEPSATDLAGLE